jgi:hypothetical protein
LRILLTVGKGGLIQIWSLRGSHSDWGFRIRLGMKATQGCSVSTPKRIVPILAVNSTDFGVTFAYFEGLTKNFPVRKTFLRRMMERIS